MNHSKYRTDIDGLRAIAVLLVVLFHAFPALVKGGFIGVDIFFVISGYLISSIIFNNLNQQTFSFIDFYFRRIKRIFPALMLVLAATYIIGWFALFADEYQQLGKHILGGAGFSSNFILWQESGYFDNAAETKPLLHLWSLGIEEQFYLLWPLLLVIAWQKKFNLMMVAIVLAMVSFSLNLFAIHRDLVSAFYLPQMRFWELMLGAILASVSVQKPVVMRNQTIISLLGVLLIALAVVLINKNRHFPGTWALLPTLGAVFIIASGEKAWFNKVILSHPILVWFGLISYPLYLWHWPLLSLLRIIGGEAQPVYGKMIVVLLAIFLAWLTYIIVEKPVRFGRYSTQKVSVLLVMMLTLATLGFCCYQGEGYENRVSIQGFQANRNELAHIPAIDVSCKKYIAKENPLFPYCRFTDAKGEETVAIIGDSHAHVAYTGIAELLAKQKINTVLMANSGCPTFIGTEYGNTQVEKGACKNRITEIMNLVISKPDIKKVYIFSRGPVYLTGHYFGGAESSNFSEPPIPAEKFKRGFENTIKLLTSHGKAVYYVIENPEMPVHASECVGRPFKTTAAKCEIARSIVAERQKEYLDLISHIRGVTIIDTRDNFCKNNICSAFDQDRLLYADYDHLSMAGSRYQAEQIFSRERTARSR